VTSSRITASATHGAVANAASPPAASTSRICSVAYATEEIGSEQNTASATRLGSRVPSIRSLCSGRPTNIRFTPSNTAPV